MAAALFWVWPSYGVWKSVRAHGYYGSALVLSLLALLLGLVLGVGWWATPQFALVAAPAVLWLVVVRRDALHCFWPMLPAAVLGALPWLVTNVRHDWYSFDYAPGGGTYLSRFRGFFTASAAEFNAKACEYGFGCG